MSRDGGITKLIKVLIKRLKKIVNILGDEYPNLEELEEQFAKCEELEYQIEERINSKTSYSQEFEDIKLYKKLIERQIKNIKDAEALSLLEKIVKLGDRLIVAFGYPPVLSPLLEIIRGVKQTRLMYRNMDGDDDYVN